MRTIGLFLFMLIILTCPVSAYDWDLNVGDGSPENPYQISEPNHLIAIGSNADLMDKHFVLTDDIVFDPNNNPDHVFMQSVIGEMHQTELPFEGTFSGNNKSIINLTIKKLTITNPRFGYIGLFSGIGQGGVVQDLNMINFQIDISCGPFVGGVAGINNGLVRRCSTNGSIAMDGYDVGGLVGENNGTIEMCSAYICITGSYISDIGGLAGHNAGSVTHSFSKGDIIINSEISSPNDSGGLVGMNEGNIFGSYSDVNITGTSLSGVGGFVGDNHGIITACYATGDVTGKWAVGGFAGGIGYGVISGCYSSGKVVDPSGGYDLSVGGFSGYNGGTTYLCFWDTQTSQMDVSFGGIGKNTVEMHRAKTFIGWGYDAIWVLDAGNDYPRLAWEGTVGEALHDEPRYYGGGNGSVESPHVISTPEHLRVLGIYRQDFDKHYVLDDDLDMTWPSDVNSESRNFNIIGTSAYPFTGTFNGQSHTIGHLHYNLPEQAQYAGLFGCIESTGPQSGIVSNLLLTNPYLKEGCTIGAIAGQLAGGEIRRCGLDDLTIAGFDCAGGIVGCNINGRIVESYAQGMISCSSDFTLQGVGGLVGLLEGGAIESCYAKGTLLALSGGGLVGTNKDGGIITSFSTVAPATHNVNFGGIVFSNKAGSCFRSYWDRQISETSSSAGGQGKTTVELMSRETFKGWGNNTWVLDDENDYPRLVWEGSVGQLIVDAERIYGGGNGTLSNPFQIWDANQLNTIGCYQEDFYKHFVLMDDIVFPELYEKSCNFVNIGTKCAPFSGSFDGNGKTLEGLYCQDQNSYVGLFGYVKPDNPSIESVKDLRLYAAIIESDGDYVGVLAGGIENGLLKSCVVVDSSFQGISKGLIEGNDYIGGLAGSITSGSIIDCSYSGAIRGNDNVGGIVGFSHDSRILSCSTTVNIDGNEAVGGLAGCIQSGIIDQCDVSGSIDGYTMVGGLAGRCGPYYTLGYGGPAISMQSLQNEDHFLSISHCKTDVFVESDYCAGGFIGIFSWGEIARCFSLANMTASNTYCGGFVGISGDGQISDCYCIATTYGSEETGGFCGSLLKNNQLSNCFCGGWINTSSSYNAFCGEFRFQNSNNIVNNCFFSETLGTSSSYGAQLTEVEMTQHARFIGWDFVGEDVNGSNEIWRMCVDGVATPRLSWEFAQHGDFACGDGVDFADLAALAEHWLLVGTAHPTEFNYGCDANGDEVIDLGDFGVLGENWP